jgi:hypothetical protein
MNQRARILATIATLFSVSFGEVADDVNRARETGPGKASTAPSAAAGTIERLQARLAAASRVIDEDLFDSYDSRGRQLVRSARATWAERFRRCSDDSCRRAILTDQLNRFDYAFGRNAAPVAGMSWESGRADLEAGNAEGGLIIFPIIDDKLLIFAATVQNGGGWICDMTAEGRVGPGRSIEMQSLDDARLRFRFRSEGNDRWSLGRLGEHRNYHCGTMGEITGTYRVQFRRQRLGEETGFADLGFSGTAYLQERRE